ncbi:MAG: efflux RND transporter periplasmic adaptor subunit [Planctomyces sp.]
MLTKRMALVCGAVVVLGGGGWFAWSRQFSASGIVSAGSAALAEVAGGDEAAAESGASLRQVRLTPEKTAAAGFSMATAVSQSLQHEHLVPGRIQYDDRRHVVVRSATAGIVVRLLVRPGQQVQRGEVLLEVNSSEVGDARADVLQRTSELQVAQESSKWARETCEGLAALSQSIRQRASIDSIRQQFRSVVLGKSREVLLSTYSELLLAEVQWKTAEENAKAGVIPGRVVIEKRQAYDQLEETLTSQLEERSFEARQLQLQTESRQQDAERRLRIARQHVRTLLGSAEDDAVSAEAGESESALSVIQLRAPFAGSVEQLNISSTERVEASAPLLTLADTTTLWVAADLRQREWRALQLQPGDKVRVIPAVEGMEPREATIHFAGREVDPTTNAVPLVSVIDNADGRLRPGMFVRVAIPVAAPRTTLTVPESSLLEHDRQPFVFVPAGQDLYERVDVQPGLRTDGLVEIVQGLREGDRVVAEGAFFLKSELLLQGESE